jgi:hypothetical protein
VRDLGIMCESVDELVKELTDNEAMDVMQSDRAVLFYRSGVTILSSLKCVRKGHVPNAAGIEKHPDDRISIQASGCGSTAGDFSQATTAKVMPVRQNLLRNVTMALRGRPCMFPL